MPGDHADAAGYCELKTSQRDGLSIRDRILGNQPKQPEQKDRERRTTNDSITSLAPAHSSSHEPEYEYSEKRLIRLHRRAATQRLLVSATTMIGASSGHR